MEVWILLQRLHVGQCHVVGSSMGAEVGLSLAAAHPELVLSLVCEGAIYNEFGEYGLFKGTAEEIERRKEVLRSELAEREERIYTSIDEYVAEQRAELTAEGLWNEYFSVFYENSLQKLQGGQYTYCYLNRVRSEYIQKYWDVTFEQYYKKVKCPVLFLPSEEEWADESIRSSLDAFAGLLDSYEITRITDSIHAYVWMQLPLKAGQAVKSFLAAQVLA